MYKALVLSPIALIFTACAHAQLDPVENADATASMVEGNGLIRLQSTHSVVDTAKRLKAALDERGVTVMAEVDHAANAKRVGSALPPTVLIIFGNPAAGTQLMTASRSAGIDLPMKALIYERDGAVFFEYNDISYIANRHGVPADLPVLAKIRGLLAGVAAEATAP